MVIDRSNRLYTAGNTSHLVSNDLDQYTAVFSNMKLEDIAKFAFQARPYQLITFTNVSLKPGFKTSVHVETETSNVLSIVEENTPILILINKQDLKDPDPISVQKAVELYDISQLVGRSFNILPTSAKFGDGVETAIIWLVEKIQKVK